MMSSELISEGSSLMLFGMGFVFLFLSLLVLMTRLMSKVITRFFSEPAARTPSPNSTSLAGTKISLDNKSELVAAISAAIKSHRSKKD
ncbi:MAG: OadG family protein [Endozoicomonas sp.]